ncbi:hypothetical protein HYT58_00055 [Candidatus Woesearchaeota archaeon]|nr:hypothetical protein [Candidatus Woesearchaeota archaeon]
MEKLKSLLYDANKSFEAADHLTYVTYPLIKDSKLLSTIADNLYNSLSKLIEAVLYYERMYKRIPPYGNSFAERFHLFRSKCAPRYSIPREGLTVLQSLQEYMETKKKAALEFNRRDRFIIATREYRMSALTLDKLKNYIFQSKRFIAQVNNILVKEIKRFEDVRGIRGER